MAIPKTATHAVRAGLRPHLAENDWEQCTLFKQKFFPVQELAHLGHGHITSFQVEPFLPGMRDDFFKFCFVRNPYDRFVSFCFFINRENQIMQTAPLGTMKDITQNKNILQHILWVRLFYHNSNILIKYQSLILNYILFA